MKKFLTLILLGASLNAYASDTILVCKIFPTFKVPKDFSGLDAMFTIQNEGKKIVIEPGKNIRTLTTTEVTYEWQGEEVTVEGKQTIMKESINRVTGAYAMYFYVDGEGKQISRGQCNKAEPRM